jgi:hypothetical protein
MVHYTASIEAPTEQKFEKNTVTIHINYPKDWEGHKFFHDGDEKEVSKEVAEHFIKMGIASYEKATEEAVKKPSKKK